MIPNSFNPGVLSRPIRTLSAKFIIYEPLYFNCLLSHLQNNKIVLNFADHMIY